MSDTFVKRLSVSRRGGPEVTARRESVAELPDTLKTVPAVGGGILLIVVLAEVGEEPLEYSMEFITATGNIPVRRRGRGGDCRTHIIVYLRSALLASDRRSVR